MDTKLHQELKHNLLEGVYLVDGDRTITYCNDGATRITGYTAEQVTGHGCRDGILRHVTDDGVELCISGCPLAGVLEHGHRREANVYLHHGADQCCRR